MNQLEARRCAVHPERDAHVICERCGNFACVDCMPSDTLGPQRCASCRELVGESRYHVVPVWRFVVMSVLSGGMYPIYWMYRTWKQIKAADRSDIWPIPRALFAGFTYFGVIEDINVQHIKHVSLKPPLSSGLAWGFLLFNATGRLPEPWDFLPSLAFVCMIPAVKYIWASTAPSIAARNAGWSTRHTIAACLAVPLWALVIIGLSLPPEEM